jgi:hypothetical protein
MKLHFFAGKEFFHMRLGLALISLRIVATIRERVRCRAYKARVASTRTRYLAIRLFHAAGAISSARNAKGGGNC